MGVLILAAEQLAYVFPLFFMFKKRRFESNRRSQEVDIWVLLVGGLVISLLLSQYWDTQAPVGGVQHSVGLLLLAFFTGAVCSSTGVVFTPYLATLPKSYTSAHTAGAGLSGLAVALLTVLADAGSAHPRLSVGRYFNVLSCVFVMSIAAFFYVRQSVHRQLGGSSSSGGAYEEVSGAGAEAEEAGRGRGGAGQQGASAAGYGSVESHAHAHHHIANVDDQRHHHHHAHHQHTHTHQQQQQQQRRDLDGPRVTRVPGASSSSSSSSPSSFRKHWPIFTLQCLLSALAYGIVPASLPLACSGYTESSRSLWLATVGFMCADPLGKLATSFLPTGRIFFSGLCTMAIAAVLLLCAIQSSQPPLSQLTWGWLLPVLANTLFSFAFSFTSISIFFDRRRKEALVAEAGSEGEVIEWFKMSAFMIQTGAFLGTALSLTAMLLLS
jgi:hypothetical protein